MNIKNRQGGSKMASPTALEQIRKLDEQRGKLLDNAKAESLLRVQEAIDELNKLGFSYSLSENGRGRGRRGVRQKNDGPCPICNFKTNPPHDGRRHRAQGSRKVAFTNNELASMGFAKA